MFYSREVVQLSLLVLVEFRAPVAGLSQCCGGGPSPAGEFGHQRSGRARERRLEPRSAGASRGRAQSGEGISTDQQRSCSPGGSSALSRAWAACQGLSI